ncbi:MAG: MlaD family protein [Flavobacteriales bacterium]|nr:MlaD family protein [Flavobacteriales bacterium]
MSSPKFKFRLGLFVAGGLALFVIAIFIIGKQRNMFDPVYELKATFYNVSGLQVGNNVRFSGINVGTVENIVIINDSTVLVTMSIRKAVQEFIKVDSEATIGSEGLIGDRLLVISQGAMDAEVAQKGALLSSNEPVETDEIMASLEVTAANAEVITGELAQIMEQVNSGEGTIGKLIRSDDMANSLDKTMENLEKSTKGLEENMEAAQDNFLLRGFFKKKERAAKKKAQEAADRKAAAAKKAK